MSEKRLLRVEDLWAFGRPGNPATSPKLPYAIVPVTTFDMEEDKAASRLYRLDPNGSSTVLTGEGLKSSQPAISPCGTKLAFVREDDSKTAQLAILPLDGGEAEILTKTPLGVTSPRWFPDGKRIAFISAVYQDAPTLEKSAELKEKKKEDKVKAYVTEDCIARFWDSWITDKKRNHLFVLDLDTKKITDLTPDYFGHMDLDGPEGSFDIAPDGSEIAIAADSSKPPYRDLRQDIFLVSTAGGPMRCLTESNQGNDWRPRYSPDGKTIAYGHQEIPKFYADRVRVVLYNRESQTHTVLTEAWDRSAASWEYTPDGEGLVFSTEDKGSSALFRLGLEPGTPDQVFRGGHLHAFSFAAEGGVLCTWDSIQNPPEVVHIDWNGKKTQRSRFNQKLADELQWGEVRDLYTKGSRDEDVQYFEVLPPNFDPKKKWPLLLAVHGGPHGIFGDAFHFRWNLQAFAAMGYVVASPNFHGSTSFGQDYADSIQGGWGDMPYKDCMAVTEAMVDTGYIDDKRMAAAGGSYGGYMMAWMASQTDRFACLINHAGVSNLMSEYACDIFYGWERSLAGQPWDGIENIDAMNPVRHAEGFKTPMLVVHGELDYRVPVTQGLEIYHMYKAKGLPSRLVVFPDENHWILKPQNSRLWYQEFENWLNRWCAS
ncbi:MAG: S9 family peptidase [Candidatus Eisenbacteria bacterium]|uniref:S9 family peptidase n=1 Tax=Eiseniibacteriota bacterium TaxID=2212470 RepID=A0A7Y2H1I9_UNCEI|nr:S9 family peptidase [Candidatus Eisenbacteria bacterium]